MTGLTRRIVITLVVLAVVAAGAFGLHLLVNAIIAMHGG
jgi:hypothetical protein